MANGTVLFAVWDALLTALRGRAGLSGVNIRYSLDEPRDATARQLITGEDIWIGTGEDVATNDTVQAHMRQAPVVDDEDIDFTLHVQVIKSGSDQETVDARCQTLFAEVQQALASNPTLSISSTSEYQVLWVRPSGWSFSRGPMAGSTNTRAGHGARIDTVIRIRSRIK